MDPNTTFNPNSSVFQPPPNPKKPRLSSSPSISHMGNHPSSQILPPELIENILSRLPVKTLLQLTCVCKSWKSLISNPQFAKLHLSMSNMDPTLKYHNIVFCSLSPRRTLKACPVNSLHGRLSNRNDGVKLMYPLKKANRYDFIVGSCDGLLCFAIRTGHVLVWNPCVRRFKKSPCLGYERRDGSYVLYGFGYDRLIDNYKVVSVFCYSTDGRSQYKTEVMVYTLGGDSWRKIQDFPSGVPLDEMGKFVNGTLNWVAASHSIVSLDLGKESYVEVSQPDYGDGMLTLTLGVLGDCLCILYSYGTSSDLWIMRDFGVKESWTKLFSIPFLENPVLLCPKNRYVSEISEILLQERGYIYWYNPNNSSAVRPEIQHTDVWLETQVYVESMIWPCL